MSHHNTSNEYQLIFRSPQQKEVIMCLQYPSPISSMSAMPTPASPFPCCCSGMMPMGGGMFPNPMGQQAFFPEEFQKQQLQFQHQQLSQMKANIKTVSESIDKSMAKIENELKKLDSPKSKKGA